MQKYLTITSFNPFEKTKSYLVEGMLFQNDNKFVIGRQMRNVWINFDKINLSKESLGKDLYCEFNDKGRVVLCEVK